MQAEVERLEAKLKERDFFAIEEAKTMQKLQAEVADEARKACEYEARSDVAEARIEAALEKSDHTLDEACPGCRDLSGVICEMVKVLKGKVEG